MDKARAHKHTRGVRPEKNKQKMKIRKKKKKIAEKYRKKINRKKNTNERGSC